MKKYTLIGALLCIIVGCTPETSSRSMIKSIGNAEFERLLVQDSVLLIDVRTPAEFATGRLANAQLIDINGNDFNQKINELNKNKKILVYCASGGRSKRAASIFQESGFDEIYELDNGISGWIDAGKPVEK